MRLRPPALVAVGLAVAALGGLAAPRVATGESAVELHRAHGASHSWAPDEPVFVLVVGSDERPGLGGARGDALQLIGVNAAAGQATIVSIPRDTWVPMPGGGMGRVNEGLNRGGAQGQVQAVAGFTGVPIHFVAVTTFAGLAAMVDELGEVVVDVPVPMHDRASGAVFPQGPVQMSGAAALAFARNRNIPGGDFSRSENQGRLILAALTKLRSDGTSAADTMRYLSVLLRHTRIEGVGVTDLYRLGRVGLSLEPERIRHVVMPGRVGTAGSASVVHPLPQAASLFADLADDGILQHH